MSNWSILPVIKFVGIDLYLLGILGISLLLSFIILLLSYYLIILLLSYIISLYYPFIVHEISSDQFYSFFISCILMLCC